MKLSEKLWGKGRASDRGSPCRKIAFPCMFSVHDEFRFRVAVTAAEPHNIRRQEGEVKCPS